ncbi:cell division site-positioning protein MapZ family protein [Vagococcus xieshaowenii]|uniref:Uncharacterized protein n=1 Tax=Vagococcus xieshaowenii TaxID=2562451 RepID=A0AAJ5EF77_9ENTE|nr:cell division site-positioning protein MapZ family protein [Vagococcus xieshaowenii]QCA28568.1 hypothetical protein E4Z98_04270 [Vagococcus xieshaowenii]TFZ40624.1 hypothetical protein E4031_07505 [Vagococcus xieshaowenii]
MSEQKKCPNCGQIYAIDTDFCPKCDLYGGSNRQFHHGPSQREKMIVRREEMEKDAQIRLKLKTIYEIKQQKQSEIADPLVSEEQPEDLIDHSLIFKEIDEETSIEEVENAIHDAIKEQKDKAEKESVLMEVSQEELSEEVAEFTDIFIPDQMEKIKDMDEPVSETSEEEQLVALVDSKEHVQLSEESTEEEVESTVLISTTDTVEGVESVETITETTMEEAIEETLVSEDEGDNLEILIGETSDLDRQQDDEQVTSESSVEQQETKELEVPITNNEVNETEMILDFEEEIQAENQEEYATSNDAIIDSKPLDETLELEVDLVVNDEDDSEEEVLNVNEVLDDSLSDNNLTTDASNESYEELDLSEELEEMEKSANLEEATEVDLEEPVFDRAIANESVEDGKTAILPSESNDKEEELNEDTDLNEKEGSLSQQKESTDSHVESVSKETYVPPVDIEKIPNRASQEVVKHANKPLFNRKKALITLSAIAVLAAGALTLNNYEKAQERQRIEQVQLQKKNYELAKVELDKLFTDSQYTLLKPGISTEAFDQVAEKINHLSDQSFKDELSKRLTLAKEQLHQTNHLNDLFESPVLADNKVNKASIVKESTKETDLVAQTANDEYSKLYNQAVSIGLSQIKNNQTANKLVNALFDDKDKLAEAVTDKEINAAKQAINQIKNESLKKQQMALLTNAQKALTQRQEAAEKAEKEKQEQELAAKLAQNRQVTVDIFGQDTVDKWQNKYTTEQSGVLSDLETGQVSSDPWQWAPGVQEAVLNECYRRGYIVDGGYELRRGDVKNGEGYYQLYATDANAPLLKKSGAKTPFYVVQINCKTGWFKGNR